MLTKKVTFYTEMIHCDVLILNPSKVPEILGFDLIEKPLIFQFGGSDPQRLAEAAKIVEKYNYDEINLNCGCPSPKVTKNCFGACLMKDPHLVAECVKEMEAAVTIPISVKCRLGVDDEDSYEFTHNFIKIVSEGSKCKHFIIHARKAFLKGLNPKKNRSVPPLMYERVFMLKNDFPHLKFTINGGIKSCQEIEEFLNVKQLYGVMVGRMSYNDVWELSRADEVIFGCEKTVLDREEVLLKYAAYLDQQKVKEPNLNFHVAIKPCHSIFNGQRNNKYYKQTINDHQLFLKQANFTEFIKHILAQMKDLNEMQMQEAQESK